MIAHSGSLPTGEGWAFEPKWDGFRAIVRAGKAFEVHSRRGWRMTELVPELAGIPGDAVLDGELVALVGQKRPLALPSASTAPRRQR